MNEWSYTPPTRAGDCVASISKDERARRHWNGERWSAPWYEGDPPDIVNRARNTPAEAGGSPIAWLEVADDDMVSLMKPRAKQFSRWTFDDGAPRFCASEHRVYQLLPNEEGGPPREPRAWADCSAPGHAALIAIALNAYYSL